MANGYPTVRRRTALEAERKAERTDFPGREAFMTPAAVKAIDALQPQMLKYPPPRLPPVPQEVSLLAQLHPLGRATVATYWVVKTVEEFGEPAPELVRPEDPIPISVPGWEYFDAPNPPPYLTWDGPPAHRSQYRDYNMLKTFGFVEGPNEDRLLPDDYVLGVGNVVAIPEDVDFLQSSFTQTVWVEDSRIPHAYYERPPAPVYPQPNDGWAVRMFDGFYRLEPGPAVALWVGPRQTVNEAQAIPLSFEHYRGSYTFAAYDTPQTTEDMHREKALEPYQRPLVAVSAIASPGGLQGYDVPAYHSAAPRVRERKFKANLNSASLLGKAVGFLTESVDMLTAVWEALPERFQKGKVWSYNKQKWVTVYYPRPQEMAADLIRHWQEIDVNEMLLNILANQLEDAAYGKMGKAAQDAARPLLEHTGRPVGLGTGPAM